MANYLNRKALCALLLSGAQFIPGLARSQQQQTEAINTVRTLQVNTTAQPRSKGELSCFDIDLVPKKTICRYLPINETASSLQSSILRDFFGGRQPGNPDESFVRVLNNGQLEFADVNKQVIDQIIKILPTLDTLDIYVERRKVNIVVQILQLKDGADDSAGFLLGAQYSGKDRQSVKEQDRVTTTTPGGLINFNFAFGNLINSVLNLTLNNYKSTNDVKVISSVPIVLTHGYQLSNVAPYSKPIYIQTTSVSSVPEQEGIQFQGQSRFHENANSKIVIKDFSISVSQFEPNTVKTEGSVEGLETFKSPVRDLELEVGCSTAIRVINVSRKVQKKNRNMIFSAKNEVSDSKKVFLFVIQALSDSKGSTPSTTCSESSVVPELGQAK